MSPATSPTSTSTSTSRRLVRGVVFDMDGTLCVSAALDFAEMRRRVGCETSDILGEVDSWNEARRTKAYEIIGEMEREAFTGINMKNFGMEALILCDCLKPTPGPIRSFMLFGLIDAIVS